jgi:hypothetical protein
MTTTARYIVELVSNTNLKPLPTNQTKVIAMTETIDRAAVHNKVTIFVTTVAKMKELGGVREGYGAVKSEARHTGMAGKTFTLNDYENYGEFMAAAYLYAQTELGEAHPKLYFMDLESGFCDIGCSYAAGVPCALFWQAMSLSHKDLVIYDAYAGYYAQDHIDVTENNIFGVVRKLKNGIYIGHFPTYKDFIIHTMRGAGATDAFIDMMEKQNHFDGFNNELRTSTIENNGHYFHC